MERLSRATFAPADAILYTKRLFPMMKLPTLLLAGLLTAAPALADPVGLYCSDGGNSFLIARTAQGDVFEVRVSSWQGMFHCGIEGMASAMPGGWRLVNQGCELQLREESGAIVLAASPHEACAPFCGARGNLNGVTFPLSDRLTASPDASLFEQDLGELNPC